MAETTFTPGPWMLETVRISIGVCHKVGRLGSSTKLNHACLYDDCYSAQPRDLQLLADAQLIAAAPELYEAARFALTVFRSHFQFDSHDFDEVRETLQAAIAKVQVPRATAANPAKELGAAP